MTSPDREQPPSHRIHVATQSNKERLDLERKVLAAAFKVSFQSGDSDGAALAHKGLCAIIQQQLFSGDGSSTGSVIPASVWQNVQTDPTIDPLPVETLQAAQTAEAHEAGAAAATPEQPTVQHEAIAATAAIAAAGADSSPALTSEEPTLQDEAEEVVTDPTTAPAATDQPLEMPHLTAAELAELSQADPTAPLNYLDFGDDDIAVAETQPEPVLEEAPPVQLTPSQLIRTQSFYQILRVSQVASFEEIHTHYLRLMRRLLRNRYSAESSITDIREFREVLRAVCVAHDVLKDPVTRADYDLRQIGMRHDGQIETPAEQPQPTQRTRLMLGELLECAQILEPAELQIALDMHKAEPGIQFGEFLVSANFLSQEELDCALLAQRLISSGKITVNQYRTGMYRMRDDGIAFFDTLMMEGWLSASDIFDPTSELWSNGTEAAAALHSPPHVVRTEEQPALIDAVGAEQESAEEPEPAAVAATKKDYDKWTEMDALAETQSIDVSAFRATLEAVSDDNKD